MIAIDLPAAREDYLTIRGRRLDLNTLVDERVFDERYARSLGLRFANARPFEHLRLQGLFDPALLELVAEEFDLFPRQDWNTFTTRQEKTFRSAPGARLGPASQLYFSIVNSGYFAEFLGHVTNVHNLIVDQTLFGGGLHESRNGGKFGIHCDFDRHGHNGLRNEMVMLTYLNKDWDPAWGGELELWDARTRTCVTKVAPDFGTTLLMKNTPVSLHGHPHPLAMPEGRTRRSVASYYYTNSESVEQILKGRTTSFMERALPDSVQTSAKRLARSWMPPALWAMARRLKRRAKAGTEG
ncbi:2OG-Fe(II) oxygenase [Pseudoxanthomonas composti]|uniref:2OG-Fe(II) oxygenase n=1 Tax=Pseudoxanthomonas composti TaxID=2137479 RepID=A0A4V1N1J2_9GAMM|nr:2OG-Fe(II) oxygenase [Pseudoxanthomonas composti]RXR08488.1 2OG-Fe(II) oxygenase [Pseudoxanthomonas composti]